MPQPPSLRDIERARSIVDAHRPRIPALYSPVFSRMAGCEVYLKLECLGPMGSYKWRGAINCLAQLAPDERARGVITASTGNHGAGVAWAARQVGITATVVLPVGMPDIKRNNIADMGGQVVIGGNNWNESCAVARGIAHDRGMRYIEDGDDPAVMAGVGTIALDILDELPDAGAMVMAVGGGNLIAGCAIAARGKRALLQLIGVQSDAAPGTWQSWRRGEIVSAACDTFAGGMATTGPVEMAFQVMRAHIDDILLVSEEELLQAIALLVRHHALITEGAGAAPLAALLRYREQFALKRVVLLVSGRNLDAPTLMKALTTA